MAGFAGDPLQGLVEELKGRKARLLALQAAVRAVELRTAAWDAREKFLARRGQMLRDEARLAFQLELEDVHELVERNLCAIDDAAEVPARKPVVTALRRELRVLQQTFAQTSPLLIAVVQQLGPV